MTAGQESLSVVHTALNELCHLITKNYIEKRKKGEVESNKVGQNWREKAGKISHENKSRRGGRTRTHSRTVKNERN